MWGEGEGRRGKKRAHQRQTGTGADQGWWSALHARTTDRGGGQRDYCQSAAGTPGGQTYERPGGESAPAQAPALASWRPRRRWLRTTRGAPSGPLPPPTPPWTSSGACLWYVEAVAAEAAGLPNRVEKKKKGANADAASGALKLGRRGLWECPNVALARPATNAGELRGPFILKNWEKSVWGDHFS